MSITTRLGDPFAARRGAQQPDPGVFSFDDDDESDGDDETPSDAELLAEAVPPAWDFYQPDTDKLREKKLNGVPIRFERVRFLRVTRDNKRKGIEGATDYDPNVVNRAWLLAKWGPGRYYVIAVNTKGHYIVGQTIEVAPGVGQPGATFGMPHGEFVGRDDGFGSSAVHHNPAPAAPAGAGSMYQPPDPRQQMADQIIQAAVARLVNGGNGPAAPQGDSMREAMAAMSKMFSMQIALQTARMQQPSEQPAMDPLMRELLGTVVRERMNPPQAAGMGPDDFLKMLNAGMQLQALVKGGEPDESQPMFDLLKTAVEKMGPGTVSLIAHAVLPPEQCAAVDDAVRAANAPKDGA